MALPDHSKKPEPSPIIIGSLADAWENVGKISAVNVATISPYYESDIDDATENSFLKYELQKGTLPLMIRARLDAQSKSVTLQLKVAKKEAVSGSTVYEKFYDEAVEITFSTSASAIAAERGGYYADTFAIVGTDNSFKGIGSFHKHAKCTYVDVVGFLNQALICTALTASCAPINS